MKTEHLEILKDFINQEKEDEDILSGYRFISDDSIKGNIIKNVYIYNIEDMYSTTFSILHENNLIDLPLATEINYYLKNKEYLKENNKSEYLKLRITTNSMYDKFISSKKGKKNNQILLNYIKLLYDDLIEKEKENILFIRVDSIITSKEIFIDLPYKYVSSKIDYILIINDFHYIYKTNGKTCSNFSIKHLKDRYDSFFKKLKIEIREDIIKKILNGKSNI